MVQGLGLGNGCVVYGLGFMVKGLGFRLGKRLCVCVERVLRVEIVLYTTTPSPLHVFPHTQKHFILMWLSFSLV